MTEFVDHVREHRLNTVHGLLREKGIECTSSYSVVFIICGSKARAWKLKLGQVIFGLVTRLVRRVELLKIVRLVNVKLVRADSNNGSYAIHYSFEEGNKLASHTVFIVQVLYLEGVVTLANYIVVELVPQSGSSELGTGEFGQRAKINAIYSLSDKGEE